MFPGHVTFSPIKTRFPRPTVACVKEGVYIAESEEFLIRQSTSAVKPCCVSVMVLLKGRDRWSFPLTCKLGGTLRLVCVVKCSFWVAIKDAGWIPPTGQSISNERCRRKDKQTSTSCAKIGIPIEVECTGSVPLDLQSTYHGVLHKERGQLAVGLTFPQ